MPRVLVLKAFGFDDYPLLVADTVVTSVGQILRKANSVEEARNILMTQSGTLTSIITCMIYQSSHAMLIDISQKKWIWDFSPFRRFYKITMRKP